MDLCVPFVAQDYYEKQKRMHHKWQRADLISFSLYQGTQTKILAA